MELGAIKVPREISAAKGNKFEICQCFIFNVRIPALRRMEYDETETTLSSRNEGTYQRIFCVLKKMPVVWIYTWIVA